MDRKAEIRNTALGLFLRKGYNQTSIQSILDELSLSKGGFYHHFKSKDELVDAIAVERANAYLARWSNQRDLAEKSAMEQFLEIFRINNDYRAANIREMLGSWSALYSEGNTLFRLKIMEKQIEVVVPTFSRLIQKAVEEGDFHTEYPRECVRLIFYYGDKTMESLLPCFNRAWEEPGIITQIYRHYGFLFHMMERILGAPEGSMDLFPPGYFEKIFIPEEE